MRTVIAVTILVFAAVSPSPQNPADSSGQSQIGYKSAEVPSKRKRCCSRTSSQSPCFTSRSTKWIAPSSM